MRMHFLPNKIFWRWVSMHVKMSEEFTKEIKEYGLVYTCEHCSLFLPEDGKCSILYPTKPHRLTTINKLKAGERMYFCKMFEAD